MRNEDARRPSDGEMHGLVACEEAIARRHGDMAPRLGQSGYCTAIRLFRASYVVAFGGDGSHALTALRRRCANRGPVKGGRSIAAGERGCGGGRRNRDEQCNDELGLHDGNSLKRCSVRGTCLSEMHVPWRITP